MNAATKAGARAGGLTQRFNTFWGQRNQRERRMLSIAAAVVVLGIVYGLLIDPALSGRSDLQKRLPALRQQAAEVQVLARQAKTAAPATAAAEAPPAAVTRASLEAALERKGLKADDLSVTGEITKLQLKGVSFAALAEWMAEMQRGARLTVLDAKVDAQAQPDVVNASLTLRQQRGEPAR